MQSVEGGEHLFVGGAVPSDRVLDGKNQGGVATQGHDKQLELLVDDLVEVGAVQTQEALEFAPVTGPRGLGNLGALSR